MAEITINMILPVITGQELTTREIAKILGLDPKTHMTPINSILFAAEKHKFVPGLEKIVIPGVAAPKWTYNPISTLNLGDAPEKYDLVIVDYFTCTDFHPHMAKYPETQIVHYYPAQQNIILHQVEWYTPIAVECDISFAITWKSAQSSLDGIKNIKVISNNKKLCNALPQLAVIDSDTRIECTSTP